MIKMSDVLIGIVLVVLVVMVFGSLIGDVGQKYDVTYTDNWTAYNKSAEILRITEEMRQADSLNASADPTLADVLGGWFSKGIGILKLSKQGSDLLISDDGMLQDAARRFKLPDYFIYLIMAILVIIVVVAIFASTLTGRDL